jgi:excisionase family DNA binding protein
MAATEFLSLQTVGELLKVSTTAVRRLIAAQELVAFKVGKEWRVRRSDLDSYLAKVANVPLKQIGLEL